MHRVSEWLRWVWAEKRLGSEAERIKDERDLHPVRRPEAPPKLRRTPGDNRRRSPTTVTCAGTIFAGSAAVICFASANRSPRSATLACSSRSTRATSTSVVQAQAHELSQRFDESADEP